MADLVGLSKVLEPVFPFFMAFEKSAVSILTNHQISLREMMGPSSRIGRLIADIGLVAPTTFTVLITGETGAGKEIVANAIHKMSARCDGPFVAVDCGSIPHTLIESELFGHEKGSFTGADRPQIGKFESASGGTLFLDEISNLHPSVQPKLLRALQENQIWRVGGKNPLPVNIRIIAASNQNLLMLVKKKSFRLDLYYRLNEFSLTVPSLRERQEDIAYLAERFLKLTNKELKKNISGFTDAASRLLMSQQWPGNVRELRSTIRRAVLMADKFIGPNELDICHEGAMSTSSSFDVEEQFKNENQSLKQIVNSMVIEVEYEVITKVLRQTDGNKAKAARILKIDNKTIHKKIKEYGIST